MTNKLGFIFFLLSAGKIFGQTCNNEDFELTPAGMATTTNAISGWTISRYPLIPQLNNCTSITSTLSRSSPNAVEVFTVPPTGLIDPNIGSTYPVFSVFGSGAANGGGAYNPAIGNMYGNTILRVNPLVAGADYHFIEKTIAVTTANCLFRIATLPVLQQGTSCCDAPALKMLLLNVSGGNTVLPCSTTSITVPTSNCPAVVNPSLTPLISPPTFTTLYTRPWKIDTYDLSPFIGSTIQFRLGVLACQCGGKVGYAYVDANCGPMEIYVNGVPFPAHTNSVTFKGCAVPTATVETPPHYSNYLWIGPAGFSSTLSTIITSVTGIYTLNITPAGTCSSLTKYVNIGLFPSPTVNIVPSKTLICKGETVTLTASGLSTYSWNVPGSTGTINVKPTVTFTYSLAGVDVNGCPGAASYTQLVNPCVGVGSHDNSGLEIEVFPNPSSKDFTVRFHEEIYLRILDNVGKEVRHFTLSRENSYQQIIKDLDPGIYFINGESRYGKINKKVMILK